MHTPHFCTKLFLVGFILTLSFGLNGQSNPDLKSLLSQSEYRKYQKADKIISKASRIIDPADISGEKVSLSGQALCETNMKKEQAYLLFKDGYNLKLRVLNGYFENYLNEKSDLTGSDKQKVDAIQSIINEGTVKSKKLYAKSRNTSRLSKSVKLQEDAQQIQTDAIKSAEKGLLIVQSFIATPTEEPVVASKDTLVEESITAIEPAPVEPVKVAEVVAPVAVVVAIEKKEPVKETVIVEEKPVESDVYFSIQVLADKKAASVTQQKMVYKGDRKMIENVGSGWYRYSVGKFKSYSEAASTMKSEGIKGFVVAYDGDERITTLEAKKILGGVK